MTATAWNEQTFEEKMASWVEGCEAPQPSPAPPPRRTGPPPPRRTGPPPQLDRCPNPNPFNRANCRRRSCPYCGPRWAKDWGRALRVNLVEYGGPVMMIAITAPGADRLPWACSRDHVHSGPKGCEVDAQAADAWAANCCKAWKQLRDDARVATLRALALKPSLLIRAWEPQKRGVPHIHVVLGMGSEAEKVAAHRFLDELTARVGEHDFGFVQLYRREMGAADAARYLVGYLMGRSKHKGTIRDNISHPRMPRSLIWLTPNLTLVTFCTMRRLRMVRWYLAALRGKATVLPRLLYGEIYKVARAATHVKAAVDLARPPNDTEAMYGEHVAAIRLMRDLPDGRLVEAAA
jgi:hypothetical protein